LIHDLILARPQNGVLEPLLFKLEKRLRDIVHKHQEDYLDVLAQFSESFKTHCRALKRAMDEGNPISFEHPPKLAKMILKRFELVAYDLVTGEFDFSSN